MRDTPFAARRAELFNLLPPQSIVLLHAAPIQYRNNDTEFPYRQDSYFFYLTGVEESNAIAVLIKTEDKNKYIVFCQEKDPKQEQWTGARIGPAGALEQGADEAYPISEAASQIPEFFIGLESVFYLIRHQPAFERKWQSWLEKKRNAHRVNTHLPHQFFDLRTLLNEMRLIKKPADLQAIRKACDISVKAHLAAMKQCRPGMREYELEAILLGEFYRQGSRYPAYPCIVGGGEQACTLHYTRNDALLKAGELVLIDAGAEYDYFAADITRTFPVNGQFTAEQQAIYELVLAAQLAAIALVKPGVLWEQLQQTILEVMVTGLVDLKILKGNVQDLITEKAYLPFYMHGSGHWLGMDVHDVGDYKIQNKSRPLLPGMVFTIEPGLYISDKGIGVRIEDDILVTPTGHEVLTQALPKTVVDLQHD